MVRFNHILIVSALCLLFSSVSHGSVSVELMSRSVLASGGLPAYRSFTFAGKEGTATVTLTNGSPEYDPGSGMTSLFLTVNGQPAITLFSSEGEPDSLVRETGINQGENLLEVIYIGNAGASFRVQVTQNLEGEAASIIGTEGGRVEITDPASEAYGVSVNVEKNAFEKDTLIQLGTLPPDTVTPLFSPYREPVSAIAWFDAQGQTATAVDICFPVNGSGGEEKSMFTLDGAGNGWIPANAGIIENGDGLTVCARTDSLKTHAIVSRTDCSAPGARPFAGSEDPACRKKWESSIYFTLVAPQLIHAATDIYERSILGDLLQEDVTRAQMSVATHIAELNGLHERTVDQVWSNAENEALLLAETFVGDGYSPTWFASLHDALGAAALGEAPTGYGTEDDFGVLVSFLAGLPEGGKRQKANELLIAHRYLYEYFRLGADESLMKERFGLAPDQNRNELISGVAAKMGLAPDGQAATYDVGAVSDIVSASLALVERFAGEFTMPEASTIAASEITATGAALGGTVNPNGLETDTWFEWGTDPDLGSFARTVIQTAGKDAAETTVTQSVAGLNPMSTYYFRVAASNGTGDARGAALSFTTPGIPPTVTYSLGEPVTGNSAALIGNVKPNGLPSEAWFEWGQDPALSSFTGSAALSVGSGATSQGISHTLEDLDPGVRYYFRVVASNSAGTSQGPVMSFTIPPFIVTTQAASDVTTGSAILGGLLDAGGQGSSAWFEWSGEAEFLTVNRTPVQLFDEGAAGITVVSQLNDLSPNSTYYYRFAASSGSQTKQGSIMSFTTPPAGAHLSTTTLYWSAPEKRQDGSPLGDLAGFKIYYGTSPFNYTHSIDVKNVTRYTLQNLPPGTWYFAVTAYDSIGVESAFSNELSKIVP